MLAKSGRLGALSPTTYSSRAMHPPRSQRHCTPGYTPLPGHFPSLWTGYSPPFRSSTPNQEMRFSRSRMSATSAEVADVAVATDKPKKNKLHMHFGAGRLAFGLVLQT